MPDILYLTPEILPEKLEQDEIFWEDYFLLYIPSKILTEVKDIRYVRLMAEEAERNGLFICADLRGGAAQAVWSDMASIVWTDSRDVPELRGSRKICLAVGINEITAVTANGKIMTTGTNDAEAFIIAFLEGLIAGETIENALKRR